MRRGCGRGRDLGAMICMKGSTVQPSQLSRFPVTQSDRTPILISSLFYVACDLTMVKKVNKKSSNENLQLTSTDDPHRE